MEKTNQQKPKKNTSKGTMEIEISRYKNMVEALEDPVKVVRVVMLIAAVVAILSIGIVGIIYAIKRVYPYKSINSNPYGATFIRDEDNEIIYWVYNSADIWANSGIHVKKGDRVTVRVSGAFSPAIHHIVDGAKYNIVPVSQWTSPLGYLPDRPDIKGSVEYRISPQSMPNAILMQSVPEDVARETGMDWRKKDQDTSVVDMIDGGVFTGKKTNADIYVIGQEKRLITIREDGILHFACNEIALTRRVIDSMAKKDTNLLSKPVKGKQYAQTTPKFRDLFTDDGWKIVKKELLLRHNNNDTCIINNDRWSINRLKKYGLVDVNGKVINKYWTVRKEDSLPYKFLTPENYIISDKNNKDTLWEASLKDELFINENKYKESEYYRDEHFIDAWFVDNIGSFMIVIERKREKR